MLLRNYTPFVPLVFQARDTRERDFGVLVLRGTLEVGPEGTLKLAQEQAPIVEADIYFGKPNESSLRTESDLAPFKPNADIHINAIAHAPQGRPASRWVVSARVGKCLKQLVVTGPRYWRRRFVGGWQLSEPTPCLAVPIRYEAAFGGVFGEGDATTVFEENPIGRGFVQLENLKGIERIDAPQVETPEDPIGELGPTHAPQGFGPIARSWLPRRRYAGTYDEAWKRDRWPNLPRDFDDAHFNSAHPDLIYPGYLNGDELVQLDGLSPRGRLEFHLPGYQVGTLFRYQDGSMAAAKLQLDTALIDLPEGRLHLTWRGNYSLEKPIRVLETRMTVPPGAPGDSQA